MNANKLYEAIINNGLTLNDISDFLGLTRVVTHRKLSNIKLLTIGEAILLKEFLELTKQEAIDIFLGV